MKGCKHNVKKKVKNWANRFSIILVTIFFFTISFNFSVTSHDDLPDLVAKSMTAPDTAVEGDNITVNVTIENVGGDIAVGIPVKVGLCIDDDWLNPVSMNITTEGFSHDTIRYFNLYWIAEEIGTRKIRVTADYWNDITESNELNNNKEKFIEVSEGPPLILIDKINFPENLNVGVSVDINVSLKNVGSSTSENILAQLYIKEDEFLEIKEKKDGLSKGEIQNFTFRWTPKNFGNHTLKFTVKHSDDIHDQFEKNLDVNPFRLKWWNENWHYRKLIGVYGSGNISMTYNFTELLLNLDIISKTFENDKIRIIEYSTNGQILNENINYNFSESNDFNNKLNAKGILTWEVTNSIGEPVTKYYYIYFDVKENKGIRIPFDETENMLESNFTVIYESLVEGWWDEIIEPSSGGYSIPEEPLDINVTSIAKADEVTAFLKKETSSLEHIVNLNSDDGTYLNWSGSFDFPTNSIGNWTIRIESSDEAGYKNTLSKNKFYVGKPDLAVKSIDYSPSKLFEGDVVTISADIRSYNVTLDRIYTNLTIKDSNGNRIFQSENVTTIQKDQENKINFNWTTSIKGKYTIRIRVFSRDNLDEWTESNNIKEISITVLGIPDLGVVNISVPTGVIKEGESVEILSILNNTGEGDAENYKVRLYLSQGVMDWNNNQIEDTVNVSIDIGKTVEVNLTWNTALYGSPSFKGEWMVGVLIFHNSTYRDSFIMNNSRTTKLNVVAGEQDPPVIKLTELTDSQEMGHKVRIVAKVTDQSGIKNVNITIINPKNTIFRENMTSEDENLYSFEFDKTNIVGTYDFTITAVDNSFYKKKSNYQGEFNIIGDKTSPTIDYFGAHPCVQLKGRYVNISSISSDFHGIRTVKVIITDPEDHTVTRIMTHVGNGKYVFNRIYDNLGKYVFRVSSEDMSGNIEITENKVFWITTDLDDIDCDGMPNWWEERFGFNPKDPSDAEHDQDGDGYTNLEEYNSGDNPLKQLSSLSEIAEKIKENWAYLAISVILFSLIIVLSIISVRRLRHENI